MTPESYIFLAGASRGVGREIAKCLTENNYKVKALVRSTVGSAKPSNSCRSELEEMGISVAMGDACDSSTVDAAMLGNEAIDLVISTIGGLPKDGQRADFLGNKNIIDASVKAGVKKFILISSIGSAESAVALPPQALETLKPVLLEKERAEKHLIESGLTYTIIRPGGLKSEPATGNGILTEDYRVAGTIHRADVAQLVYQCLLSEVANNKILAAIDKNMMYGAIDFVPLQLT
ncbi:MAG: SDR family oxidoreductase [Xenococcaceae cyanobacterium]